MVFPEQSSTDTDDIQLPPALSILEQGLKRSGYVYQGISDDGTTLVYRYELVLFRVRFKLTRIHGAGVGPLSNNGFASTHWIRHILPRIRAASRSESRLQAFVNDNVSFLSSCVILRDW